MMDYKRQEDENNKEKKIKEFDFRRLEIEAHAEEESSQETKRAIVKEEAETKRTLIAILLKEGKTPSEIKTILAELNIII
jgi:hypothetical protein